MQDRVGFLHALFGLAANPIGTAKRLMAEDFPPYILSLLLCILLSIFVPFATQIYFLKLDAFRGDLLFSLLIIIFFSYVVFAVVEMFFLQLLGIDMRLPQMMASIVYSFVPLMFACWVVYLMNKIMNGSLTIITLLLTAYAPVDPTIYDLIKVLFVYVQLLAFITFSTCIREVSHGSWLSAMSISAISGIPFYLCIVLGIALAEFAVPGTLKAVLDIAPWIERLGTLSQ